MDLNEISLIPPPSESKVGDSSKILHLEGVWSVRSNCPSNRLLEHTQKILTPRIKDTKLDFPQKYDKTQLMMRYPYGFLQPRDPFFIQITPANLKVDEKIVIKSIQWQIPWEPRDYRAADEYDLVISRFIQITSRSERGLFYGLQTLKQLLTLLNNSIPFQTIHDLPKLSIRAIHLDFKKNRPTISFLFEQIQILAYYKINTVVIEWEDKFPFQGELQGLCHKSAFTLQEKDQLLNECWNYFLEVIPLIQSLGHLEFVLKNPPFHQYCEMDKVENPSSRENSMICPLRKGSRELIQKIHDQILQGMGIHKESEYIHIGLDETYYLGECPECKTFVEKQGPNGKSRLFIEHLNWIAEYHLAKGKRPWIWGDMLIRFPQMINAVNKHIILCDWEYEMPLPKQEPREKNVDLSGETIDYVRTWNAMTLSEIEKKRPANYDVFFEKYWRAKNGKYPFKLFPNVVYFQQQGFTVITSPAVQSSVSTPISPNYLQNFLNITYFNNHAIRTACLGSLCTNWVVRNSPWPMLQFGFIVHAWTTWNNKAFSLEKVMDLFWHNFFQISWNSKNQSHIANLHDYFITMGKIGGAFNEIFALFNDPEKKISEGSLQSEILQIYQSKLPQFLEAFKNLSAEVHDHQKFYEFFLLLTQFAQLIGAIISNLAPIEQLALSMDVDNQPKIPSLDTLKKYIENVKDLPNRIEKITEEISNTYKSIINPIELQNTLSELLDAPRETMIKTIHPFISFYKALSTFIEEIVQNNMKRLEKKK